MPGIGRSGGAQQASTNLSRSRWISVGLGRFLQVLADPSRSRRVLLYLSACWCIVVGLDVSRQVSMGYMVLAGYEGSWMFAVGFKRSCWVLAGLKRSFWVCSDLVLGRSYWVLTDLSGSWQVLADFGGSWQVS